MRLRRISPSDGRRALEGAEEGCNASLVVVFDDKSRLVRLVKVSASSFDTIRLVKQNASERFAPLLPRGPTITHHVMKRKLYGGTDADCSMSEQEKAATVLQNGECISLR